MHSYLNAGKCCHAIVISDHHITQASEVPNTKLEGPRRGLSFKPVHAVAVLWFASLREGHTLRHGKRILASIEPDKDWPGMWRVRLPNGQLTDTVNLTRAKDAAVVLALDMSVGRAGAVFLRRAAPRRPHSSKPISQILFGLLV